MFSALSAHQCGDQRTEHGAHDDLGDHEGGSPSHGFHHGECLDDGVHLRLCQVIALEYHLVILHQGADEHAGVEELKPEKLHDGEEQCGIEEGLPTVEEAPAEGDASLQGFVAERLESSCKNMVHKSGGQNESIGNEL